MSKLTQPTVLVRLYEDPLGAYADAERWQEKSLSVFVMQSLMPHLKFKRRMDMVCIITTHNAALPELYELNIGHAIIGRAVFSGLAPVKK